MNADEELFSIVMDLIDTDPDGWEMHYIEESNGSWKEKTWFWLHTATKILVEKGDTIQGAGTPFRIGMTTYGAGFMLPSRRQRKRLYRAFLELRSVRMIRAVRRVTG